ncbi:MAG: peptide ABC transporter substrate-binding protein [Chlamydiales bacterium]
MTSAITWFLSGLLILASCSKSDPPRRSLKISFNCHPTSSDPRKAGDFTSSTLVCMIYEGLTRCKGGGEVELALAEKLEISANRTVYLFHLRKAYWTDGQVITAADFERSWKQILSQPSSCTYLFYPIRNAELCARGKISVEEVGIKALNDRTLRVELERPTPYFYSLTAFPSFLPAKDDLTLYSGPFRIEKIAMNSEIVLKKNGSYWNRDQISLDEIHISIVSDEMTALQMFERGDLDWLGGSVSPLPPDAIDKLQNQIQYLPCSASTFCAFNTETFPFNNIHLRKAFSLAINREEIVQRVTQGRQIAARSVLPPSFSSQSFPLFDPTKARIEFEQGLAELGIKPQELETLILYFKTSLIDKQLAQTLQQQWKEVLGVTVQLGQLDFKSHAAQLQAKTYLLSLASWIAPFDDPISLLDRFRDRTHLKNYPGWERTEYNRLLNEAAVAISSVRTGLLMEAEELLVRDTPLAPIYHWSSPALCSPRVKQIAVTPSGGILFEKFRREE